jgi:hypothetical protein
MKSLAPAGIGLTLLLLVAAAAAAAPAAPTFAAFLAAGQPAAAASTPLAPVPADDPSCGLPRYFCQVCSPAGTARRLCSEKICGTFVIVNCGDCQPVCHLPPS